MRSSSSRPRNVRRTPLPSHLNNHASPSPLPPLPTHPSPSSLLSSPLASVPSPHPLSLTSSPLPSHPRPTGASSPSKRPRVSSLPLPPPTPSSGGSSSSTSRIRKLLHLSPSLSLTLQSFLPPLALDWASSPPSSPSSADVSGRVTDSGWCLLTRNHTALVWRVRDTPSPPSFELSLLHPLSSAELIAVLPSDGGARVGQEGDLLVLISDDGHVSWWREPVGGHSASPPSPPLTRLPLARDETATCAVALPTARVGDSGTVVVGTSKGRVFSLTIEWEGRGGPQVRAVVGSGGAKRGGLMGALAALVPWGGGGGEGEGEILGMVWWRGEHEEGVWTLSPGAVKQWRVSEEGVDGVWEYGLGPLAADGETMEGVALASSSSSLYLLFRRSLDGDDAKVTAHVAHFPVDWTGDEPFDAPAAVFSLPSYLANSAHLGVSQHSDVWLYAYSRYALVQLNASNSSTPSSAYSFPTPLILGGGMVVDDGARRQGSTLPAYDHAHCLLLCASYGVVAAEPRSDDGPTSALSALDLADPATDPAGEALSVAFHLYRHGQTKAAAMRMQGAWEEEVFPGGGDGPTSSPEFDRAVVDVAQGIVDGREDVGGVGQDNVAAVLSTQLAGKQQTLTTYLSFLHDLGLYLLLHTPARFTLLTYAEQVSALLGLRHLLNAVPIRPTRSDLEYLEERERIMLLVMQHSLRRRSGKTQIRRGASVSEAFFQQVSDVGDVFASIEAVVQAECDVDRVDSAADKRLRCYGLQAMNSVVDTLLSEAARYRAEQQAMHTLPPSATHDLQWTFQPAVREALLMHCQFVACTIRSIADKALLNPLRVDLFQFLLRIARSLLLDYVSYTEEQQVDRVTLDEYHRRRADLLLLLRDCLPQDLGSRVDVVFDLAAEFADFHSIIRMAEDEEDGERERRISQSLQMFGEPFARVLFDVYHAAHQTTRLFRLHEPVEYEQWLLAFLAQHPEVQWVQQVALDQWQAAGSTLMQVAAQGADESGEQWSWAHQKTMWSLSKLALLCSDTPDAAALTQVDDALDVSTAQAYAAQGDADRPLLEPSKLVLQLLSLPHKKKGTGMRGEEEGREMESRMTPFILAMDVYHKGNFPWTQSRSGVMGGEELMLLERVWRSLYDVDRVELRGVSERRRRQASDMWMVELKRLHLYAMWRHLLDYDFYDRRSHFEASYEHFVQQEAWTKGDEGRDEVQHIKQTLQLLQQTATQKAQRKI